GIQETERVSFIQLQAFVHGIVNPGVRLGYDANERAAERSNDLQCAVGRTAVDDDHFLVGMSLIEKGVDRMSNRDLGIEADGDDADFHAPSRRLMNVFPMTRTSIFVLRKQSNASSGLQTTGSFSLNDVFS